MGKEMGDPSGDVEKTGLNAVLLSSGELEGLGKKEGEWCIVWGEKKARSETRGELSLRAGADEGKRGQKSGQQEVTRRDGAQSSPSPVLGLLSCCLFHLVTVGKALDLSKGDGRRALQARTYSPLFIYLLLLYLLKHVCALVT